MEYSKPKFENITKLKFEAEKNTNFPRSQPGDWIPGDQAQLSWKLYSNDQI